MEFTTIPNIKKQASKIGLGTWAIGGSLWGGTNERESIRTIHQALDQGINLIDTAPAYGKGESERIVGKALKEYGKRDRIIIATKFGLNQETENVFRDTRKESILKEVEDSLKRLQVDHIDLYLAHWPDPSTPIAEMVEALNLIRQQGKISAYGVCNFTIKQMDEFQKNGHLSSLQFPFNLFEQEQQDLLSYCLKKNITTLGYGAICRGLLSGKMKKNREFQGDDLRKSMDPKFKEPRFSQYLECVKKLEEWSKKKYNRTVLALAVRWVLDKGVGIALWGARNPSQLRDINDIFGWRLTSQDFKDIDKIIHETVKDPIGTEFMSPPERPKAILK